MNQISSSVPAHRPVAAVLAGVLCISTLLAGDPPPPPGGFGIKLLADQRVTYIDGYKTLLDIRYPDAAPSAQGWPCLMVVHGGGGSRKRGWVVTVAEAMTRAGYVTVAYDTGGNGATVRLNGPARRPEALRARDMVEIFADAEALLGARMDHARLAVMGKSGGGKHALWAATFSERQLPAPAGNVRMPKILAVHSDIQVLDFVADNLIGGNIIAAKWAADMYDRLGANDPLVQKMINGDYAALHQYLAGDVMSNFLPLLKQSDVPLLISYAYDDKNHSVNVNGDSMPQLKTGVPRRYLQLTGGHASAANNIEAGLRRDFTRRWCDRFLKGIKNGVAKEPFAEIAIPPSAPADYTNANSEWKHRRTDTWPIAPSRRLYLRGNGELAPNAPTSIEAGATLRHRVAQGYGMLQFMQDKANPAVVTQKIPMVARHFDMPPAPEPMELLGRTVVELEVINSAADFQLNAALLDVAPSGKARFITSGVTALRRAVPGRHRIRIELGDVGYVIEKGHRLRLALENLNVRRQPGNPHMFACPDFDNCDIDVQIDPAFAPRVDLPLNRAGASLTPRFARVRASAGVNFDLKIRGEVSRAGADYLLMASGSGTTPGVNLPPHVPLNFDVITSVALDPANSAVFRNFYGRLNAQGDGRATLFLPPPLANVVLGMRLSFVAAGIDASNQVFVSDPVQLIIEP